MSVGSIWQRWDPHLHAPGTLLNDNFGGDWDGYIRAIETADPRPVALGITDYCTLRAYKEVVARRKAGALKSIPLVFANVELRLSIETKRKKGINLHLLVSPDDLDHIDLMEKHLSALSFEFGGKRYFCEDRDLMRLGRAHKPKDDLDDLSALREGANQFKPTLPEVRDLFKDAWVRDNVLVAVAAGEDGLSGLADDSGFHANRLELGRFADIIFSGNPNDRIYWSGENGKLRQDGLEPRPCLHGSDAHSVGDVLKSSLSPETGQPRRCWVKGSATFESLRQTLAEPVKRAYIGAATPSGPNPSETIEALRVPSADWFETKEVQYNSGLVAIIGAKGSGKTALLELAAIAASANDREPGPASFVDKAGEFIEGTELTIAWKDDSTSSAIIGAFPDSEPRVRYLSQRFVETLCSSSGESADEEPLQREIENVVFDAIPEEDRLLCSSFSQLRETKVEGALLKEEAERTSIRDFTRKVAEQNELRASMKAVQARVASTDRAVKALEGDLARLPVKANDEIVKAHAEAGKALSALRDAIASAQRKEQSLRDVISEVQRRVEQNDAEWQTLKTRYGNLLDEQRWELLRFRPTPNYHQELEKVLIEQQAHIGALRMLGIAGKAKEDGLKSLEERYKKLGDDLGLDQVNGRKRLDIEKRLGPLRQALLAAKDEEMRAINAAEKAKDFSDKRSDCYRRVFDAFDDHVRALEELYRPLQGRLASEPRLRKLTFTVRRVVDLVAWARHGERLFDLRTGEFNGIGALEEKAKKILLHAWEKGSSSDVRDAIDAFTPLVARQKRAQDVTPLEVGEWLFSTDHIHVRYSIEYDGLSLSRLSPGTRGVVLLTLYLALDQWDQRPLLIDQPEENLDPRSIYDELVPFFRDAAQRRQVIMVTHNANLVVNTDSDQVVIAQSERQNPGELPKFRYLSGGLEDPSIRAEVCRLLEGGEEAFERRRRRYRYSV